jgi:hypothetical protein
MPYEQIVEYRIRPYDIWMIDRVSNKLKMNLDASTVEYLNYLWNFIHSKVAERLYKDLVDYVEEQQEALKIANVYVSRTDVRFKGFRHDTALRFEEMLAISVGTLTTHVKEPASLTIQSDGHIEPHREPICGSDVVWILTQTEKSTTKWHHLFGVSVVPNLYELLSYLQTKILLAQRPHVRIVPGMNGGDA